MQIASTTETDQRGDLDELVLQSALQVCMRRHRIEELVFRDFQRVSRDDRTCMSGQCDIGEMFAADGIAESE